MHTARMVHPQGLRRRRRFAGLARALGGLGGAFELNLTPDPGGIPIGQSVQTSEMQVTGTFAAEAPGYLDAASARQTEGMITQPSVRYSDGTVITAKTPTRHVPGGTLVPASPMDAVRGATRTASDQVATAHEASLDPTVEPGPAGTGEAIDGSWQVANGTAEELRARVAPIRAPAAGMQWWHWGLVGLAVLGGGYALTRVFAR